VVTIITFLEVNLIRYLCGILLLRSKMDKGMDVILTEFWRVRNQITKTAEVLRDCISDLR